MAGSNSGSGRDGFLSGAHRLASRAMVLRRIDGRCSGVFMVCSQAAHELEDTVVMIGQILVSEIGVNNQLFGALDAVEGGELGGGWTYVVHKPDGQHHFGSDPGRQMLNIDVAEAGEDLSFPLVKRVEFTEILFQLSVGPFGHIHFPDSPVITEEGEDGCGSFDPRFEGATGEGEAATLAAAQGPDPGFVDIVHGHDEFGETRRIEEDMAIEKIFRFSVESADDVSTERPAGDGTFVFGASALTPAIEGSDSVAHGGVAQFIIPFSAIAGVTMEHEDSGMR